jgi:hypothetical protein
MNDEAIQLAADCRIRRTLLRLLGLYRAKSSQGWVNGALLIDGIGNAMPVRDEEHARQLIAYLVDSGYVEHRDDRTHKHEKYRLETLSLRITALGQRLLAGKAPVDPLIADDRRDGSERD